MAGDDFRYDSGAMGDTISQLRTSQQEANDLTESIKSILRDKLLEEGISGSTAEALIESFETEVVQTSLGFSEETETYIAQNETVQQLADEMSEKNRQVASQ